MKGFYSYDEPGLGLGRTGCIFQPNSTELSLLEYSVYLDSIRFGQESHTNIHKRKNVCRTNGISQKWDHIKNRNNFSTRASKLLVSFKDTLHPVHFNYSPYNEGCQI